MSDSLAILTRSGLDIDLAVLLAEASAMAYKPAISIKAWAKNNGLNTHISTFDEDNIQGFWCAAGDVALLCFRGTSNPGQWIRDLRLIPVEHPWGRVHAGFKGGIDIAEPHIYAFEQVAKDAKHVWVTGHSLGGALAVLAAARLRQHGLNPFTYTYGQPRPGLGGFRDRFESELPDRLIRFVNQDDIVPRVPPGLIYRHAGIVKTIKSLDSEDSSFGLESMGGGESAGPPEIVDEEPPEMSDEEFAKLQADLQNVSGENFEGAFDLFTDHFMTEYVRLLTDIRGAVA